MGLRDAQDMTTRILIADDHPIFRDGLTRLIESAGGREVVGEASSSQETIDMAGRTKPDLVICDVVMPGRGAVETIQDLKRILPKTSILMLSGRPEDHLAMRCLKEGASGYVTKGSVTDELLEAIRRVSSGGRYVSPAMAEQLVMSLDPGRDAAPHERLSDREYQVMSMIAVGKTPREIAEELFLSVKTVSTYRARILEKMELKNNAELMRYALREGLVT